MDERLKKFNVMLILKKTHSSCFNFYIKYQEVTLIRIVKEYKISQCDNQYKLLRLSVNLDTKQPITHRWFPHTYPR